MPATGISPAATEPAWAENPFPPLSRHCTHCTAPLYPLPRCNEFIRSIRPWAHCSYSICRVGFCGVTLFVFLHVRVDVLPTSSRTTERQPLAPLHTPRRVRDGRYRPVRLEPGPRAGPRKTNSGLRSADAQRTARPPYFLLIYLGHVVNHFTVLPPPLRPGPVLPNLQP